MFSGALPTTFHSPQYQTPLQPSQLGGMKLQTDPEYWTSSPDSSSYSSVFIPSLSRALGRFLKKETLKELPEWEWKQNRWRVVNPCCYHVTAILDAFYTLMCRAMHRDRDTRILTRRYSWQTSLYPMLKAAGWTPKSGQDFLRETIESIDLKETWGIFQAKHLIIRDKTWLISCALHPQSQFSSEQEKVLRQFLDSPLQFSNSPCIYRFMPGRETDQIQAMAQALQRVFTHEVAGNGDHAALPVLYMFRCIAMAVSDIWEHTAGAFPGRSQPPFGSYRQGLDCFRKWWCLAPKDCVSLLSPQSRQALSAKVEVGQVFDIFWYLARLQGSFVSGHALTRRLLSAVHEAAKIDPPILLTRTIASRYARLPITGNNKRPPEFPHFIIPPDAVDVQTEEVPNFNGFRGEAERFFFGTEYSGHRYFRRHERVFEREARLAEANEDVQLVSVGPEIDLFATLDGHRAGKLSGQDLGRCAICLDNLNNGFPCIKTVVCRHIFHTECLTRQANSTGRTRNRCSLCRSKICRARPVQVLPMQQAENVNVNEA
ncbi:hypothetical protein EJ04DRAFT_589312 [Polyplosphaeria fusca]|uniref:RING-type domain-containing protein n=1 Tax=Polyplosphaeria fusca TaxID=682080 RepID=A0A9P4UWF9_9PLEO|nr:hypothetical protein EJ04DRAFT_589312 [Polyplosphaeria fusca]